MFKVTTLSSFDGPVSSSPRHREDPVANKTSRRRCSLRFLVCHIKGCIFIYRP